MADKRAELALSILDLHGRDALRRAIPEAWRGCIPAARMAQEFCRAVNVPCVVRPVLCILQNKIAHDAGIVPWNARENPPEGAGILICGDWPGLPDPGPDAVHYHCVPIIAGQLVDMTLDAQTSSEKAAGLGFPPMPTIRMPAPGPGKIVQAEIEPFGIWATYVPRWNAIHEGAPWWREFVGHGGMRAVVELVGRFRKKWRANRGKANLARKS